VPIVYLADIIPTTNAHEWTQISPSLQLLSRTRLRCCQSKQRRRRIRSRILSGSLLKWMSACTMMPRGSMDQNNPYPVEQMIRRRTGSLNIGAISGYARRLLSVKSSLSTNRTPASLLRSPSSAKIWNRSLSAPCFQINFRHLAVSEAGCATLIRF